MTVQAKASFLSVAAGKNTTSQSTQHENWAKKTGSTVDWCANKATEATAKASKAPMKAAAMTFQPAQSSQQNCNIHLNGGYSNEL